MVIIAEAVVVVRRVHNAWSPDVAWMVKNKDSTVEPEALQASVVVMIEHFGVSRRPLCHEIRETMSLACRSGRGLSGRHSDR